MKSLCLSIWAGQQIKEKYQNGYQLKTTSQNHKRFDVHIWGHMCICVPNMKFLCLTLCQGEVCTDANVNTNAG